MATPLPIPGLVLAGGASRRMGSDKAALRMQGQPLVEQVAARLARQTTPVWLNLPQGSTIGAAHSHVSDTVPDRPGPLAGILAGLEAMEIRQPDASHLLTIPVDTPFFPDDLVRRLYEEAELEDIVVASSHDRLHPVVALWPATLKDDLADWLSPPHNRRVFDFINRHRYKAVHFDKMATSLGPIDPFFNINTPADLEQANRLTGVLWT
ncbi:molybdenum cofactor guanylyltransferase MobA [Rhizobium sp. AAP43]|uniref:molybdenum cofactor guanylyltransferase MobA n=1 Tax=Rhizobium sp. AAP43 TaxID=1523420 RepID=UPI0006B97CEC|nr:molybdenum cofactor guanylyltransferase MobA [Rhizobium sp. AAP43]KPF43874.1 hypothetical protein IP76_13395 [Rhizobium sp. AAP43]